MVEHKHNMDYRSLLSLVVGGVILSYASYGLDGEVKVYIEEWEG